MNLELNSGLKVSVLENGDSKLLLFDRPVKVVELTKEESIRLGSSLTKGGRAGITAELRNLIYSNFFSKPKSFGSIKTELFLKGVEIKPTSLNMLLTKMVERKELDRIGKRGSYLYQKPR